MSNNAYRRVFGFAWSYWKKYPARLAALLGLVTMYVGCSSMLPFFSGRLIDVLTSEGASAERALGPLLGFVFTAALIHLSIQVNLQIWIRVAADTISDLTKDAFGRVQHFSTDWHANNFAGATVRKITRGMWAFDLFGDTMLFGIIPAILIVVIQTTVIGIQLPLIALLLAVATLIYISLNVWLAISYVQPENQRFIAKDSKVGAGLADAITCNAVVKAFGAERREQSTFDSTMEVWRLGARKSWGRMINVAVVQAVLRFTMQSGMLIIAVWAWSRGVASPGEVTLAVTAFLVLDGYLREIGHHVRSLQQSVNELEDLVEFAEHEPGVADRPNAKTLKRGDGAILFDDVTFGYENQSEPIYQDFTMAIPAGERVALVGRSGSGKSTFVKLVQRLYDVESGGILIDGQNIADVTQESLRQAIAIVPQEPVLFHRTLAENIAYAKPGATRAEVEHAAMQAHADEFIARLNDGYDTMVGERGVKLSGGERQRIAIARAFLADSPILILDEATSSLDSITEGKIQDAVHHLMEGRTTILIAHRLSTIQAVDRVLVFADGKVVEQGPPRRLLGDEGHYARLYNAQARGEAVL